MLQGKDLSNSSRKIYKKIRQDEGSEDSSEEVVVVQVGNCMFHLHGL